MALNRVKCASCGPARQVRQSHLTCACSMLAAVTSSQGESGSLDLAAHLVPERTGADPGTTTAEILGLADIGDELANAYGAGTVSKQDIENCAAAVGRPRM